MSSLSPRPFNSMFIVRVVAAALLILGACGGDDDSAAEAAAVFFDEPAAGATVTSPVSVEMEASNLTIEAAGGATEGAGHMHIMVDVPCVTPGRRSRRTTRMFTTATVPPQHNWNSARVSTRSACRRATGLTPRSTSRTRSRSRSKADAIRGRRWNRRRETS